MKASRDRHAKERRERQLAYRSCLLAKKIESQEMLERLLDGADPILRAAMIERIRPHLSFDLVQEAAE